MMRFWGYFRSSAAWRCRIAFNLKGMAPTTEFVNLRDGAQRDPEFLARNPQGFVPALETGDGALLTQSLAILEWLEETRPEPPLLPADPTARAEVRAFALAIACDIHPLQNLRVLTWLREELGQDEAAVTRWLHRWLGDGLAACEAVAARQVHGGAFVFGDAPSLADVCLVPQMASADRFGLDTAPWPRLRAVRAACEALPAFADAAPSRQPDAV